MSEEKKNIIPEKKVIEDNPKVANAEESNLKENAEKAEEQKTVEESDNASETQKELEVLDEIEESNAEDAEDTDTQKRHEIPLLDYHSMSMENLVGELQRLIRNEKVQAIKKHVDSIRDEFNLKFQDFIEQKKEDFIANGGNEIDFKYNSVTKRQFNEVYAEYREKRNQHYKNLEKSHKENLAYRLELIENLKGLVNVEEDINTTYKNFKEIQEKWRNAGPIPRTEYNNVWRTYHHHIEIFYDFLHLNRELRDLDFKHNLEEKQKIVERAEALAAEPDLNKAFRELQVLHKIWKEDIGPVGKEHREEIWQRFSNATKVIHERRQEYFKELDKLNEQNLEKKNGIIEEIKKLSENIANNHRELQKQIKQLEELRESFFKAGKVPQKDNEKTWSAFKTAVRSFNRNKNAFYKNLKKEQQENLDKKRALLEIAVSLKDSDDFDSTTAEMKRIQSEWKKIGHVPRKFSDKLWKEFKEACNHYFDRLHASKNDSYKEESENLEKKEAILSNLKAFELSGEREADLQSIKKFIEDWKAIGHVPFKQKNINQKFNKIIDALFNKLNISPQESELLKYGNKIQKLKEDDNQERAIQKERSFIRKKIEESKNEIRQLENNLQFFSNDSENNPLVKDVIKRVESHKEALTSWKNKLKKLNILQNNLQKVSEEETGPEEE
ncbi:DUF349 domain-containing protein [Maribacter sp. MMG018]|uniref:DUF349 domain-containing protein n=1 Tax=Maribacter sp. MMG018 TaxID=2822688 RepID=UPI001B35FC91|nr:DUF349 domain-containing protein [Maribacter sp. MMG018]MBQ4915753.1 DUF349 domain-containing protein [Maribacter sp. MMG018]